MSLRAYRTIALAYFKNKCQKCGSSKDLVIHHIDGNRANNNIDNLTLICAKCHRTSAGRPSEKRIKLSVSIDSELIDSMRVEAQKKNLSLSRLIENKLKGV